MRNSPLLLSFFVSANLALAQPTLEPPPRGQMLDKSIYVPLKTEISPPCYTLAAKGSRASSVQISIMGAPIDKESAQLIESPETPAERAADRAAQMAIAFKSHFHQRLDRFGCQLTTFDDLSTGHSMRFFDELSHGHALLLPAPEKLPAPGVLLRQYGGFDQGNTFYYVPGEPDWFGLTLGYIR
jgi:hypothetical protein